MTKADPIIAVKNVEASSVWYQKILGCRSMHGGKTFDILVDDDDSVLLCLHHWGDHGHPTMQNPEIAPGNGLILYFRTTHLESIRQRVSDINWPLEEDVHRNENSTKREFSLRDPDGYYLTISEFHRYDG